jgi:hypothetical protein
MSTIHKTIVPLGNAHINTSAKKFGAGSGYFDGTGDYLGTVNHEDFNFGSGNFTIDFWFATIDNTKSQYYYMQNNGTADNSIVFARNSTNTIFYIKSGGSYVANYTVTDSVVNGTWYHYELVRDGSNIYIFKNGVKLTLTETIPIESQDIPVFTGNPIFCYVWGYIDEFRISKGIARHTSNFTKPTQAYWYDSYTVLLLHFNGLSNSTSFKDNAFGQKLTHTAQVKLLQYVDVKLSEVGTTTTNIKITGHGLEDDDFIINTYWAGTQQNDPERGSRRIEVVDADNLTCPAIAGQSDNEDIRLYHFTDVSSYVDLNSINANIVAEGNNSFNFTMSIPSDSTFGMELLPIEGQCIKLLIDDDEWFCGIISNTSRKLSNNIDNISLSVSCMALKNRAYTRTISVNYASGTASATIVNDMINYLIQEGIEAGTIETGVNLSEAWTNDTLTIGEVLDELCEKNGFQWYIDEYFRLDFVDQRIFTSYRDIVQDGEFTDFRDVVINGNLADYRNKMYFVGGNDLAGRTVRSIRGDMVAQDYTQAICGGSGVYGEVIRNSSITSYTPLTAGAGTDTYTVNATSHGAGVGDYFLNATRNIYAFVISVTDANNYNCTSVTGQTSGDLIIFHRNARNFLKGELKRMKNQPYELVFQTLDMTFDVQQRLYINLPLFNIEDSWWNVESVQITDVGRGYFSQIVTCVLADDSDFSSQRRRNKELDFFRRW